MKKNLMNKVINSRMQKDKQYQSGIWLYMGNEIAGYMTPDGEFFDLRQQPQEDKQ